MRFYRITNIIKTTNTLFLKKNKQFTLLENKPFLMGALLLKHSKFDKKLIVYIKNFLIKMFSNNNNQFYTYQKMLCINAITFFDKTELYKLLDLNKNTDIYVEKSFINKHDSKKNIKVINKDIFETARLSENTRRSIYLYLYIVKYFFDYIRLPKLINILKKVFLCNLKEKRISFLKIMLDKLGRIYLTKLNINSLHSLIDRKSVV